MRQLLAIAIALAVSACALKTPGPIEVDSQKFPLDSTATDISALRYASAIEGFHDDYDKFDLHKAFAQSRSGAWGFSADYPSLEFTLQSALDDCRKYNLRPFC